MNIYYKSLIELETELGVKKTNQSYFLQYEDKPYTVVLAIHGYSATPIETYEVASVIHQQSNCDVFGLRLPGHGTSPENMADYTYEDWIKVVDDTYQELKKNYNRVILYGISMGAMLSLNEAAMQKLDGIICSGTMINSPTLGLKLFKLCGTILTFLLEKFINKFYLGYAKGIAENRKHIVYNKVPYSSINNLGKLINIVKKKLMRVTCPILILHSKQDTVSHSSSASLLYKSVSSENKQLIWVEGNNHTFLTFITEENQKYLDNIIQFCRNPTAYFNRSLG